MKANIYNVLDTYALIEIKEGNPKYIQIINEPFVIINPTIAEFYIVLMREEGEEEAKKWFNKLKHYCVSIEKETFIEALKFREKYKKRRISIFDSLGYIYAKERDYDFVTGDKEFEKFENVKFIK